MKKEIFDGIAAAVAERFSLSMEELFFKTQRQDVVDARYVLYYIAYYRPMRIRTIQNYTKAHGLTTTHSNIIHGIKQTQKKIEEDPDYVDLIEALSQ